MKVIVRVLLIFTYILEDLGRKRFEIGSGEDLTSKAGRFGGSLSIQNVESLSLAIFGNPVAD